MHKLLLIITASLMMLMYASTTRAEDTSSNMELVNYCDSKIPLIQELFIDVAQYNSQLYSIIMQENKEDLVPVLFAQSKMEITAIILYAALMELVHSQEAGKLSDMTIPTLNQYIYLLYNSMIKVKMFEGMLGSPVDQLDMNSDRMILLKASVKMKVAHDLLVKIRDELEELK